MSSINVSTREILKNRQVLFISGFFNEFNYIYPIYYKSNLKSVEADLDMEGYYYGPPSRHSIAENAENIFKKVIENHKENGKPVILVGHSKGGAEILYAILKNPELILNGIVDRAVLIQAPIGGCACLSEEHRNIFSKISSWVWGAGLESMDEKHSIDLFNKVYMEFKERLKQMYSVEDDEVILAKQTELSEKVFYVRTSKSPKRLGWALWFLTKFVRANPGLHQGDGLLHVDAQKFKPESEIFGVDLGVIEADHNELTAGGFFCNSTDFERRAFTRALFAQIYESR